MLTPKFLKSIEAWQSGGDLVVSQLNPAGMGNWPPARNVALSPEIALSVGSARVRITRLEDQDGLLGLPEDAGEVAARQRLAERAERIVGGEIEHGGAAADRAGEVDPELLDDVALYLGDGDLEHHLVASLDDDAVDDAAAATEEAAAADHLLGHVVGLLRLERARRRAGHHDPVAQPLDVDVGVREHAAKHGAQAVQIARHRDVKPGELATLRIEEIDAGLAARDADQVGAPRRADDRIGDLGIGHQHVLDVARQVDHHRLADAERHERRPVLARRDLRKRPRVGAGVGGAQRAVPGRRQGDDRGHCRGADQRLVGHGRVLSCDLIGRTSRSKPRTGWC
jgi:hypothetical protein